MPRKKFKRYYTGHTPGQNGKGSWQRDAAVPDATVGHNWCLAHPHLYRYGQCQSCGKLDPTKEKEE